MKISQCIIASFVATLALVVNAVPVEQSAEVESKVQVRGTTVQLAKVDAKRGETKRDNEVDVFDKENLYYLKRANEVDAFDKENLYYLKRDNEVDAFDKETLYYLKRENEVDVFDKENLYYLKRGNDAA